MVENPLDNIIPQRASSGAEVTSPPAKKPMRRKKTVVTTEPPEPVEPPQTEMEVFLRKQAEINQGIINETDKVKVAKVSMDGRAPEFPDVPLTPEEKTNLARVEQTPNATEPKTDAEPSAPEKTVEELKADLDAKRVSFARFDLDISGRWNKLKRVLGFRAEEIKDSGVEEKKNEYIEALKKYKDAKRASLGNLTKEQAEELLYEFKAGEALKFLEVKGDENAKMKKEKGEWPESVMNGYMSIVKNFKALSFKKKILISAGIMAGGIVAGMTFGVVGASVFTIAGAGYRAISGGATGLGLKKLMDTVSAKREKKAVSKEAEKFLNQDDWLNQLNAKLDEAVNTMNTRIGRMESKDLTRKRIATFTGIFVGSGAMAQIIHSTGLGGFLKDKLSGGGAAATQAQEAIATHAPEVKTGGGLMGYGTEADGHNFVDSHPEGKYGSGLYGSEAEGHDVVAAHPEGKYGSVGYGTEGEGHINEFDEKYGPEKYGTEAEGHISETEVKTSGSLQNWAETTHAAGAEAQTPEIAKPKFEDIPVKIKAGGNMWASIEHNIKANPSAYGLDQTDPNFKTNMNGKISGMLHDFAKKNGLSYKQLDKVFEGDNFKIGHDAMGKPYLYDFHGKAFGADVSHGGAGAAQDIASNKPNMAVENAVKPKAGIAPEDVARPRTGASVAPEHQPTRGGQANVPDELTPQQKIAQEKYANAVRAEQELQAKRPEAVALNEQRYDLAHVQQVNETGKLLCRVFEEAGVSKWADVLNQPMKEWSNLFGPEYQISQDVKLNDATDKVNLNLKKLKELYPILKKYQTRGIESIGECLFKAMKDPANVLKINMNVLTSKH